MRWIQQGAAAGALALAALGAVSLVAAEGAKTTAKPPVLPFIENDYSTALTQARQKQVPLFIEVWAPW